MGVRVSTTVSIDAGSIRSAVMGESGPVYAATQRAGGVTRDRAKVDLTVNNLVDKGLLRQSIESETFVRDGQIVSRVGTSVPYAGYVHEGTQGPIVPRRARVLRFKPKGASAYVFADSVSGTRETGRYSPFLTNALRKLTVSDFT